MLSCFSFFIIIIKKNYRFFLVEKKQQNFQINVFNKKINLKWWMKIFFLLTFYSILFSKKVCEFVNELDDDQIIIIIIFITYLLY